MNTLGSRIDIGRKGEIAVRDQDFAAMSAAASAWINGG